MLDNSISTTQHPMAISDRIDTYKVDCMSLSASLERRLCTLVLQSYIHPLARSPLAAGINWATACIAKQKRLAKPEDTSKEDTNGRRVAIEEPAHGIDDSKRKVKPKVDEVGRAMDGVFKALDELQAAVQEWTEGIEETNRALEARATLTRALEARGILF